ncbi:replication initiation protein [Sphingobium baderi]|uniref:Uncharacterized protein n=1 Tax=Sphingobium baderi TaxID=1332080 RepID=A0A0S3F6H4_9SPHN|nr:replication initiation protein [Sphingobium baderi]ALR23275.1 hypothetical protein ATN00_22500 [Sphingobium baderi]
MISTLWEIAAVLDEDRIPANVPNSVWLSIPTARLRGPNARQDNVWLRECLERMIGLKLTGQHRNDEWGAVLVAEWHITEGGSKARILIPPAGVHALRSTGNFVKIETTAAHRLPPHARRLYALLADRKRQREPYAQWSVDNLRGLLGVDDKRSYEVWSQFRKWVLTPAIEAINDFGTVRVKMTTVKSGRSVSAVRFEWRWKDPHDAADTVVENERHSDARRKDPPENPDAPPLVEGDPVVREGLAQLVADLGNSKRVQEPEQMDVETYLALRDEDRPEYPITDDERAWLDMRPVGNEEL